MSEIGSMAGLHVRFKADTILFIREWPQGGLEIPELQGI